VGKEIKSTLEIVMEKVAKLPKLTPEEVQEQRQREFGPRGRAIANRYLEGTLQHAELEAELSRFREDERRIVRRSLQSSLCDAIHLEQVDQSHAALKGLQVLEEGTGLEGRAGELGETYAWHLRKRDQLLAEFEESGQQGLAQLGISGPAIRPNPDVSEDLRHRLQEAQQALSSSIEELRRALP
jgi:hypothetical protein